MFSFRKAVKKAWDTYGNFLSPESCATEEYLEKISKPPKPHFDTSNASSLLKLARMAINRQQLKLSKMTAEEFAEVLPPVSFCKLLQHHND